MVQQDSGSIEACPEAEDARAGKFHGISSLLNLIGLGTAVGHGWWLASRLSIGLA